MAATLRRKFTLCTADCGEEFHTADYVECARCGAHVHKTVFEVQTDDDVVLVGAECFQKVMGWKYGAAHDKATEIAEVFAKFLRIHPEYVYFRQIAGRVTEFMDGASKFFRTKTPYGLSKTVLRAGIDLGYWEHEGGTIYKWRGGE